MVFISYFLFLFIISCVTFTTEHWFVSLNKWHYHDYS